MQTQFPCLPVRACCGSGLRSLRRLGMHRQVSGPGSLYPAGSRVPVAQPCPLQERVSSPKEELWQGGRQPWSYSQTTSP